MDYDDETVVVGLIRCEDYSDQSVAIGLFVEGELASMML